MTIDMRKLGQEFMDEGAFVVIARYVRSGQISPEVAARWVQQVFLLYQDKVREAQREVKQLDVVLGRLAGVAAQGGSRMRPYVERDPLVISLAHEVTTFDNWVMSIYETDLSMIGYGAPERAKAKPLEMSNSMQALTQKRLAERDFGLNAPELFKRG